MISNGESIRCRFLLDRDGKEKTQKWYEFTWRVYLAAGLRAIEIGNFKWAQKWIKASKECLRLCEDLR